MDFKKRKIHPPSLHYILRHTKYQLEDIQVFLDEDNSSINGYQFGETPLMFLINSGNCSVNIAKTLLRYGADVNFKDALGRSLFYNALECSSDPALIVALLEAPSFTSINEVDSYGDSPLVYAIKINCSVSIVKVLLQYFANVNLKDKHGRSALFCALECRSDEAVIRALLEAPRYTSIHEVDQTGCNPLLYAIRNGCLSGTIKLLLQFGVNLSFRHANSGYPIFILEMAIKQSRDEATVRLLIKYSCLKIENFAARPVLQKTRCFKEAANFAAECTREVQEMTSVEVGRGRTLREIVSENSFPRNFCKFFSAQDTRELESIFNQLLKIKIDIVFPIYFDMMLVKVDKQVMIPKLHEVVVHSLKNVNSVSGLGKVLSIYECACGVAQHLQEDDLFRLALAFNTPHD